MKIVQAIILMALGVLLIGLGVLAKVALRPLMQEGFWPGLAGVLAGVLICFGVLLAVAQIARMPRRSRLAKVSGGKVARLLAAYPGPVTLKASRSGWVMMVVAVVWTALCIIFGVIVFLGQQAGNKAAGDVAEPVFEMGLCALVAGMYSACALLRGALQLDRNGFQATLILRKQYLWTEVCDFRGGPTSGVRFSVVKPRLPDVEGVNGWSEYADPNDKLGDNYGLDAEELADLMESWRSAALDDQGNERPLAPAVPK
jgi:hypothetical protein